MIRLKYIPSILIAIRLLTAPLLLLDAWDGSTGREFIVGYVVAVASDIFDGIIARRLKVSTAKLRQADSWADILLYLCVAISVWRVYPEVVLAFQTPLWLALGAQLSLFTISLLKFGKFPSFHTYTAKIWGLCLLVATVGLFGFGYSQTLWLAILLCWLNSLEEILMTLVLPSWQCDVLSLFDAIALRRLLIG